MKTRNKQTDFISCFPIQFEEKEEEEEDECDNYGKQKNVVTKKLLETMKSRC